jgi:hypothetical protein
MSQAASSGTSPGNSSSGFAIHEHSSNRDSADSKNKTKTKNLKMFHGCHFLFGSPHG